MKNCGIFINIDIHAHRGGDLASLNDKMKKIVIYVKILGREFS